MPQPDADLTITEARDRGYLTRREAADRAGVHPNTIRGWEGRGLVTKYVAADGRRRQIMLDPAELDAAADSRPERSPSTDLAVPAETLWAMAQEAGAKLTEALEAKAAEAVRSKMLAGELDQARAHAGRLEERLAEADRRASDRYRDQLAAAAEREAELRATLRVLAEQVARPGPLAALLGRRGSGSLPATVAAALDRIGPPPTLEAPMP